MVIRNGNPVVARNEKTRFLYPSARRPSHTAPDKRTAESALLKNLLAAQVGSQAEALPERLCRRARDDRRRLRAAQERVRAKMRRRRRCRSGRRPHTTYTPACPKLSDNRTSGTAPSGMSLIAVYASAGIAFAISSANCARLLCKRRNRRTAPLESLFATRRSHRAIPGGTIGKAGFPGVVNAAETGGDFDRLGHRQVIVGANVFSVLPPMSPNS